MTKSEYMKALQEKLESFNRELQQEILEDYEQHFAEGLAEGKTEEKIIRELGAIEDMIREIPIEDTREELPKENPDGADAEPEEAEKSITYKGEYKAIVLNGMSADIVLEKSEDQWVHVEYQNNGNESQRLRYRFYQYEEDGVFYAGVKDFAEEGKKGLNVRVVVFGRTVVSYGNHSSGNCDIRLSMRIPAGMPRVGVETVSGDINVQSVQTGALETKTISGDVEIRGIQVGEFQIRTTSGDIDVAEALLENLELSTVSGDVKLSGTEARKIRLRTTSGDVSVKNVTGENLKAGTISGDVELEAAFLEYSVHTGSGDVKVEPCQGARKVSVLTRSGDASVNLNNIDGAEVAAEAGSGDIIMNISGQPQRTAGAGYGYRLAGSYGDGSCKVSVKTGSGDIAVKR